jgi:putative ABC transport system permease protein
VFARADVDVAALISQLRALPGSERVVYRSNRALRTASLEVFDRTFAITIVLRALALAVAFVGVLGALMALQLERAREIGVLRALGLTPRQLSALVITQTGLIGLAAGTLAMPLGLMLAWTLIHVVNRRSFGWTIDMLIDPGVLLQSLALATGAALVAGAYPAWKMARMGVGAAVRTE